MGLAAYTVDDARTCSKQLWITVMYGYAAFVQVAVIIEP